LSGYQKEKFHGYKKTAMADNDGGRRMNYCGSCGVPILDGQDYCYMCVGDMSYGNDGYYEQWATEQDRQYEEELEAEYQQMLADQESDEDEA
jgi:hypothetical protein